MMPSRCRDELIIGGWSVWSAIYPLAAGHSVVASDGAGGRVRGRGRERVGGRADARSGWSYRGVAGRGGHD